MSRSPVLPRDELFLDCATGKEPACSTLTPGAGETALLIQAANPVGYKPVGKQNLGLRPHPQLD